MLRSLTNLPARSKPINLYDLPLKLSIEERRSMWPCPAGNFFVSAFSCLQCEHYKVYNQRTTEVVKESGRCLFPRRADSASQRITNEFFKSVYGKYRELKGTKKTKKKGGMHEKRGFLVQQLRSGVEKKEALKKLKKEHPKMSDAYANTLYYQATKQLREEDMA